MPSDNEGPDLATLERHCHAGVKGLYVMPNCQNPTGTRISAVRRQALLAWSQKARVPLIEDDYASDLQLDGQLPPPALRSLDGDVIYMGTYSKKLIPALRIGYLLCPPALRPHLTALKHAIDLGTSGILQHALAEFLERGYLRAHLALVVRSQLRDDPGFHVRVCTDIDLVTSWLYSADEIGDADASSHISDGEREDPIYRRMPDLVNPPDLLVLATELAGVDRKSVV